MKYLSHRSLISVSVLLVSALLASTSPDADARRSRGITGQAAPRLDVDTWFNLPAGQRDLDLDDLHGQVVVMLFFQSWCPGCHSRGFPLLAALDQSLGGADDVTLLAVQTVFEGFDTNTADAARRSAEEHGLTIPIGHDPGVNDSGSRVMQRYRSRGTPWVVIVDKRGTVRFNDFHLAHDKALAFIEALRAEP